MSKILNTDIDGILLKFVGVRIVSIILITTVFQLLDNSHSNLLDFCLVLYGWNVVKYGFVSMVLWFRRER